MSDAPEYRLASDAGEDSPHRPGTRDAVLILALFGFCFAFFPPLSMLFNELVKQDRFELENIGTAYTILVLSQGGASLVYGMASKTGAGKTALFWSFIATGLLFFSMRFASGYAILALCALLGVPLGVMLTNAIAGVVTFGKHAVRMQGLVSIVMRALQLGTTVILSGLIVPHFAAAGGFTFIAATYLVGAFIVPMLFVDRTAPVTTEAQPAHWGIGVRGAIGLGAALLIFGSRGAVLPYVVPLAQSVGLEAAAVRQALSIFVAGQLAGAFIVSLVSFGKRYISMLTAASLLILASGLVCALSASTAIFYLSLFILAAAFAVKDVFVMPMLTRADPSLRAARQTGTASLFGEALGPLASGALLSVAGVQGSLLAAAGMIIAGMTLVYGLELSRLRIRK